MKATGDGTSLSTWSVEAAVEDMAGDQDKGQ